MKYTEQQLTSAVVSNKLRPNLADPGSVAPGYLPSLIQRCWDADPLRRPSFDDIIVELESMMEHVTIEVGKRIESGTFGGLKPTSFRTFEENINWFTQGESFLKGAPRAPCYGLRKWLDSQGIPVTYSPVLSSGSFSTCGRRETMEDTHFLMPQMCNKKEIHLFGVFDGHRGAAAAEYSVKVLPGILQSLGSLYSPSSALVEAFLQTDVAFRNELDSHRRPKGVIKKDFHPGCTAIAALIVQNKLYVASAGDCRTILCRAGCPIALSRDHIASRVDERERILSAGGEVQWQVDTWRVGPAALQVTRSIGDDDLKPAVTAEPEITNTEISIDDEYLVMATDGLWDVLSDEDVVSIIRDTVKDPGMCSKRLATEAAARGSNDNITVIVVFLRPVSTAERIF
ncbi:hypothetical protein Leryth_006601 [Lithospermum erythrorhizon]|uniref:Protein phosphatase n=1 Tax=Lithospermum erythrorhizon TaxID=34254 RepID=A0AAV3RPT2_LITER|nr:hypothetical protein Leryth_006601 [Lithospermum erythrorhizon]